jgi:hypothetical protein
MTISECVRSSLWWGVVKSLGYYRRGPVGLFTRKKFVFSGRKTPPAMRGRKPLIPNVIPMRPRCGGRRRGAHRVLVDEEGVIIAGHGRHQALLQEKFEEVRVLVAVGWSEPEKRKFRLADNQIALTSTWDGRAGSANPQSSTSGVLTPRHSSEN